MWRASAEQREWREEIQCTSYVHLCLMLNREGEEVTQVVVYLQCTCTCICRRYDIHVDKNKKG